MAWKQPIPTGLEQVFGPDWRLIQLYKELIYRASGSDSTALSLNRKGGVDLVRGQVLFGERTFARYLGFHRSLIRRKIIRLEELGKVTCEPSHKGTLVTLVNFDELVGFKASPSGSPKKTKSPQPGDPDFNRHNDEPLAPL